ncbi:multidrug resistance efflux pump [Paraburkholderia youngii]
MLIAIGLLVVVLWRLDHAPSADDAYVYADTISVVPEVSGRIIDLPVRDNQAVKQGDLLLRIDPRPYQAALDQVRARLDTLNNQIVLTQRTVHAQQYNADSVQAAVERARAVANQAEDTLRRTEPLLAQGYVSAEEIDRARTAQRSAQAELNAAMREAQQASAAVSGVDALVAQRAEVRAQIALAELNLEFTEVHAPFDGRVVSLRTTVGQFASALKPVFTLIDTRHCSSGTRSKAITDRIDRASETSGGVAARRRRRGGTGSSERAAHHQLGACIAALPGQNRRAQSRSRAVPHRYFGGRNAQPL